MSCGHNVGRCLWTSFIVLAVGSHPNNPFHWKHNGIRAKITRVNLIKWYHIPVEANATSPHRSEITNAFRLLLSELLVSTMLVTAALVVGRHDTSLGVTNRLSSSILHRYQLSLECVANPNKFISCCCCHVMDNNALRWHFRKTVGKHTLTHLRFPHLTKNSLKSFCWWNLLRRCLRRLCSCCLPFVEPWRASFVKVFAGRTDWED